MISGAGLCWQHVGGVGSTTTTWGTPAIIWNRVPDRRRSQSVAVLCAGLLRSGMVCQLERVLRVCDDFSCGMSVSFDGAVLL